MSIQYTFKDLAVYLLTGFISFILTIPVIPNISDQINKINYNFLEKGSILIILITIGTLYFVGHLIQICDLVVHFIIRNFLKKYSKYKIIKPIYYFTSSSTISYELSKIGMTYPEFEKKIFTLRVNSKIEYCEYFNFMKDLFNGLQVMTVLIIIYILTFQVSFGLLFLYILLLYLFWLKSKNSASNYVSSIINTFNAFKEV